jgi:hypothetical protein
MVVYWLCLNRQGILDSYFLRLGPEKAARSADVAANATNTPFGNNTSVAMMMPRAETRADAAVAAGASQMFFSRFFIYLKGWIFTAAFLLPSSDCIDASKVKESRMVDRAEGSKPHDVSNVTATSSSNVFMVSILVIREKLRRF